ncbi:MAG: hypothetical protein AAGI45_18540 [Cyanobacteria bacterium P01_H01_bin.26]
MAPPASATPPPWSSVSAPAQTWLVAAAQTWEDTQTSEQYIQQALAQPDPELDVYVGAYRYYFYKNQNENALAIAHALLKRIQQSEQWSTEWDDLKPILLARLDDDIVRLYLSTYVASGMVLARLGHVLEAEQIAHHVQQLNAKEFGAEVLFNILNSPLDEED